MSDNTIAADERGVILDPVTGKFRAPTTEELRQSSRAVKEANDRGETDDADCACGDEEAA